VPELIAPIPKVTTTGSGHSARLRPTLEQSNYKVEKVESQDKFIQEILMRIVSKEESYSIAYFIETVVIMLIGFTLTVLSLTGRIEVHTRFALLPLFAGFLLFLHSLYLIRREQTRK